MAYRIDRNTQSGEEEPMLHGEGNTELKMPSRAVSDRPQIPPTNIQEDVEGTITEYTELRQKNSIKGPPPNIQDDVEGTIIENTELELKNSIKDPPPNIQDDEESNNEIIKRPAGCYIIR